MGAAGLQRHVEGGPAHVLAPRRSVPKCLDLGMGLAGAPMPSLTEDTAAEDEDGPDEGLGTVSPVARRARSRARRMKSASRRAVSASWHGASSMDEIGP